MRRMLVSILLVPVLARAAAAQQQQQPESFNLQRVVDIYIASNLELQAGRYRVERAKADQIAARLRPNPGFTVTAENFAFGGPAPFSRLYEIGASYSETIESGGKRELRERVADLTVSAAEAQFADVLRRGVAAVKRLYYDAVLARYNVEVAVENRQTFEQLLQFNQVRFQEGAIAEAELIKVRLERMKVESALKDAGLNLRQATIRLQERLGTSTFNSVNISGGLEFSAADPGLEALRQLALTERSDIQAAARELDAANERLKLERARGQADVTPFVGYKRVASDNTLLFGVSVPLKVRDRNQAGVARAEADIKAAQTQLQLARNRALADVESAYEAFRTAREQVQTFRSDLLGQADESRFIALAVYTEGGSDLLPLLETERTRSEVRKQYFRILFDYRSSLIDLELAVGREIQP